MVILWSTVCRLLNSYSLGHFTWNLKTNCNTTWVIFYTPKHQGGKWISRGKLCFIFKMLCWHGNVTLSSINITLHYLAASVTQTCNESDRILNYLWGIDWYGYLLGTNFSPSRFLHNRNVNQNRFFFVNSVKVDWGTARCNELVLFWVQMRLISHFVPKPKLKLHIGQQ